MNAVNANIGSVPVGYISALANFASSPTQATWSAAQHPVSALCDQQQVQQLGSFPQDITQSHAFRDNVLSMTRPRIHCSRFDMNRTALLDITDNNGTNLATTPEIKRMIEMGVLTENAGMRLQLGTMLMHPEPFTVWDLGNNIFTNDVLEPLCTHYAFQQGACYNVPIRKEDIDAALRTHKDILQSPLLGTILDHYTDNLKMAGQALAYLGVPEDQRQGMLELSRPPESIQTQIGCHVTDIIASTSFTSSDALSVDVNSSFKNIFGLHGDFLADIYSLGLVNDLAKHTIDNLTKLHTQRAIRDTRPAAFNNNIYGTGALAVGLLIFFSNLKAALETQILSTAGHLHGWMVFLSSIMIFAYFTKETLQTSLKNKKMIAQAKQRLAEEPSKQRYMWRITPIPDNYGIHEHTHTFSYYDGLSS